MGKRLFLLGIFVFSFFCTGFTDCCYALHILGPDTITFLPAEPLPKLDALFERADGWIGGDGAYSVSITPRRTLWLFSDTWVGKVRNGKRQEATIVNNSVAMQDGAGHDPMMTFFVKHDAAHKPEAMIKPVAGPGWYWLFAGARVRDQLFVILSQMEKTKGERVFAFRGVSQSLGVIDNPDASPAEWRVQQLPIPFTKYSPNLDIMLGTAIWRDEQFVYVFGTMTKRNNKGPERGLIVGRVGVNHIADFTQWRFFREGEWVAEPENATQLADRMASEGSVTRIPNTELLALVYTDGGMSEQICVRTAKQPWGPWSAPTVVYRCPESKRDSKLFCYAAKAHPSLAKGEELIISYVVNSFDFWQVAADSRLYWPRFVRVPVHVVK